MLPLVAIDITSVGSLHKGPAIGDQQGKSTYCWPCNTSMSWFTKLNDPRTRLKDIRCGSHMSPRGESGLRANCEQMVQGHHVMQTGPGHCGNPSHHSSGETRMDAPEAVGCQDIIISFSNSAAPMARHQKKVLARSRAPGRDPTTAMSYLTQSLFSLLEACPAPSPHTTACERVGKDCNGTAPTPTIINWSTCKMEKLLWTFTPYVSPT